MKNFTITISGTRDAIKYILSLWFNKKWKIKQIKRIIFSPEYRIEIEIK